MAVTMKQLLAAGAHFGHRVARRNPAFKPFIHSERNGIHVINTAYTMVQLEASAKFLKGVVADGGKVLFVATKPQARDIVEQEAIRCGQYFVTFRWLGGLLTNFKTVRASIQRMINLEEGGDKILSLTKKEQLKQQREFEKLHRVLKGVREMRRAPDAVVIVDIVYESIAVHECTVLGVPVVGIADTNSNPTLVAWPIPGNDDAVRAVELYMQVLTDAILEGISLHDERAQAAQEEVEETELALDREEDMDEAALLARRKVYKVKKTIRSAEAAADKVAGTADSEAATPIEAVAEGSSEQTVE